MLRVEGFYMLEGIILNYQGGAAMPIFMKNITSIKNNRNKEAQSR